MQSSPERATLKLYKRSGLRQRIYRLRLPIEHRRVAIGERLFRNLSVRYTVHSVLESRGDNGSFEELAMPYFDRLFNFACWLTSDPSAAEDLVQETYMKALRGFSSFQQGTNFRAWIYRILRNSFLTSRTGLKPAASLDDEEMTNEPATEETPESLLLASLNHDDVWRALEQLPASFREVILLCDLEEMSYQEIAQALGIPIGTVMSRLSRARKAMRTLLCTRKEAPQP